MVTFWFVNELAQFMWTSSTNKSPLFFCVTINFYMNRKCLIYHFKAVDECILKITSTAMKEMIGSWQTCIGIPLKYTGTIFYSSQGIGFKLKNAFEPKHFVDVSQISEWWWHAKQISYVPSFGKGVKIKYLLFSIFYRSENSFCWLILCSCYVEVLA